VANVTDMKLDVVVARVFCLLPLSALLACAPAVVREPQAVTSTTAATGPRAEYVVGGRVTGLEGIGLTLRASNGDEVKVDDDGRFAFGTRLEDGADYEITLAREPIAPVQRCMVERGAGTIEGKNAVQIAVVCATVTFDDAPSTAVASR
jgi:hypothetical protein